MKPKLTIEERIKKIEEENKKIKRWLQVWIINKEAGELICVC